MSFVENKTNLTHRTVLLEILRSVRVCSVVVLCCSRNCDSFCIVWSTCRQHTCLLMFQESSCVFIFYNYMYKCFIAVYIFKKKLVSNVSITNEFLSSFKAHLLFTSLLKMKYD